MFAGPRLNHCVLIPDLELMRQLGRALLYSTSCNDLTTIYRIRKDYEEIDRKRYTWGTSQNSWNELGWEDRCLWEILEQYLEPGDLPGPCALRKNLLEQTPLNERRYLSFEHYMASVEKGILAALTSKGKNPKILVQLDYSSALASDALRKSMVPPEFGRNTCEPMDWQNSTADLGCALIVYSTNDLHANRGIQTFAFGRSFDSRSRSYREWCGLEKHQHIDAQLDWFQQNSTLPFSTSPLVTSRLCLPFEYDRGQNDRWRRDHSTSLPSRLLSVSKTLTHLDLCARPDFPGLLKSSLGFNGPKAMLFFQNAFPEGIRFPELVSLRLTGWTFVGDQIQQFLRAHNATLRIVVLTGNLILSENDVDLEKYAAKHLNLETCPIRGNSTLKQLAAEDRSEEEECEGETGSILSDN